MQKFNILTVNSVGTTISTIELAGVDNLLLNYKLSTPNLRSIEHTSPLLNGSNIALTTMSDVTETAQVLLQAASATAMTTLINSIEQAFFLASERQRTRRGNRIFLEIQTENTTGSFRSEIKRGQLNIDDKSLGIGWIQNKLTITLTYTRAYFFESTTKTEIPIASRATAKTTGGVTVYNHYFIGDSGVATYVDIEAADVKGVIDTPMELWIKNTYNSGTSPNFISVGQQILGTPGSVFPVIQAEDGTWNGTTSLLSNVAYSGTQARSFSWTSDIETKCAYWLLNGTELSYLAGASARIFAKLSSIGNPFYITFKIKYQAITLLDQTVEVLTGTQSIQDLGVLQFPPWLADGGISADLYLEMYVRQVGGSSFTLDFLHLMPMDGYAEYRAQGYGLTYNWTLKDNAPEDRLIVTAGDNLERGYFVKRPKNGLMLRPNTKQRLYFLQTDVDTIGRTLQIRAFYRERRLTV
jgi:hypothetical protein